MSSKRKVAKTHPQACGFSPRDYNLFYFFYFFGLSLQNSFGFCSINKTNIGFSFFSSKNFKLQLRIKNSFATFFSTNFYYGKAIKESHVEIDFSSEQITLI